MPKPATDPIRFLAHLPLFASVDPVILVRIAASVRLVEAPRGSTIFRRGDACLGFHAVVYGQVKLVLRTHSGGEKVVEVLGPRQSFGEAVMFLEKPYLVDSHALADTKLLFVPREVLFEALEEDPKLARQLLGALSARLHRLISDLEAYTLHSGRERVVGYLLSALPERRKGTCQHLTLTTRKSVIASRLSLTQEHFSRILQQLSVEGLISVNGREITIPDASRLQAHRAL
jgi:CRP-like cAMP-binding protein